MLVPKSKFAQLFLGYSSHKANHKSVVAFVANDLPTHPSGKLEREPAETVLKTVLEDIANGKLLHWSSDLGSIFQSLGRMVDILQRDDLLRNFLQRFSIAQPWPKELIILVASQMVVDAQKIDPSDFCAWDKW
jgi:hypothetical protein